MLCALISLSSVQVFAAVLDSNNSSVLDVATEYLTAIVNKDTDTILNLSKEETAISEALSREDVLTVKSYSNETFIFLKDNVTTKTIKEGTELPVIIPRAQLLS